jgi:hypothetical protein
MVTLPLSLELYGVQGRVNIGCNQGACFRWIALFLFAWLDLSESHCFWHWLRRSSGRVLAGELARVAIGHLGASICNPGQWVRTPVC